jgi:hypothetical protein
MKPDEEDEPYKLVQACKPSRKLFFDKPYPYRDTPQKSLTWGNVLSGFKQADRFLILVSHKERLALSFVFPSDHSSRTTTNNEY